jgi:hypothetical protein
MSRPLPVSRLRTHAPAVLIVVLLVMVPLVMVPLMVCATAPAATPVSIEGLQATVDWLTAPALLGRRSGTPGAAATADYLLEQFSQLGMDPAFQEIDQRRRNVVARIGTAPEHVIVGAHYDGQGGSNPGASDNAAGVAVLLELARDFIGTDLDVSLVFIAFDDEEQGLNGSRFYAANPVYPLSDTRAAIILDTMGRGFVDLDRSPLIVMGAEMSTDLASILEDHAGPDTIPLGTDLVGARSDFAPFAARDVPYLFFTNATHKDYHARGDTPDKIRYDRLAADAAIIQAVISGIAIMASPPEFLEDPVYPLNETENLAAIMGLVEAERPDLVTNYRVLFEDARARIDEDPSRLNIRLATEVLLAAATPRFSFFSLAFMAGPLYETEGKVGVALAAYREALRWAPDNSTRNSIQEKIDNLER